jgi:hypothetical protein
MSRQQAGAIANHTLLRMRLYGKEVVAFKLILAVAPRDSIHTHSCTSAKGSVFGVFLVFLIKSIKYSNALYSAQRIIRVLINSHKLIDA